VSAALPESASRHRLAASLGLDVVAFWKDGLLSRISLEASGLASTDPRNESEEALARWIDSWNEGHPLPLDLSLLDWLVVPVRTARILEILAEVPFGGVVDYGGLAARCGIPHGARAVGQAMARNPFPLVLPCHRVLAHGGLLGGYSAGGQETKRLLLLHEGVRL